MKRDFYADVSGRILAERWTDAAPWVKPWSQTPGMNHPHNAATGRPYSGSNRQAQGGARAQARRERQMRGSQISG
jgi:antirestriction protein ArdC